MDVRHEPDAAKLRLLAEHHGRERRHQQRRRYGALAGGLYSRADSSRLEARSTTSTEVRGFKFDTQAGDVITVEAALGSVEDGSFLFFVEGGKVNGGFTGKLTNPLRFEGSTP